MNKKVITSTSRSSAACTDVVLRYTDTRRLVFRPTLVKNVNDPDAAVHGTFAYQRKGVRDAWEDMETVPLSRLKKGETYKLDLHASEVLVLFRELAQLYKLYSRTGIPVGRTELVPIDSAVASLSDLPADQINAYLSANSVMGEKLLSTLLSWAVTLKDPMSVISRLVSLDAGALRSLNVAVGLHKLRAAIQQWECNLTNRDERFWQQLLMDYAFVLEQVFAWPTMIVKGKAYVGGKSFLDKGGNVADFLLKNSLTSNVALVEIKTPCADLLARRYRGDVYSISDDLNGAVMQVLNYRHSLQQEFHSLARKLGISVEAFEPRCAVIAGMVAQLGSDKTRIGSLELYRNALQGVDIITFDELFEKTRHLIDLLESP
jgi:hypothetical protein